mgnify:CR=1 FL=1
MNEIAEKDVINIENMIYEIDGKEVMLDSDLAKLYNAETKRVNEAVNRNKEKFPSRISWITNDKEVDVLWSQNATANISPYLLSRPLKQAHFTQVSLQLFNHSILFLNPFDKPFHIACILKFQNLLVSLAAKDFYPAHLIIIYNFRQ